MQRGEKMKILDCTEIATQKNLLNIFVGANGTGKSYDMQQLFTVRDKSVLFEKNGYCKISSAIKEQRFFTKLQNTKVVDQEIQTEKEKNLQVKYREAIEYFKGLQEKLQTKYISSAIAKLLRIIESLLNCNFEEQEVFYFDEPETSLDDSNIKNISKIVQYIMRCKKQVFIVTHSPRLLEVLQPNISQIFLKQKLFGGYLQITEDGVYNLHRETAKKCQEYLTNPPKWVQIYIEKPHKFFQLYMNTFMHSHDFYRSLFYNNITLAEGLTEQFIVNSIEELTMTSNCFIFTHGKFNMPFLIQFYQLLGKKVYCVFDSDIYANQEIANGNKAVEQINQYLEEILPPTQRIVFEPNLERELNIDNKVVKELFTENIEQELNKKTIKELQHKFKPFIAVYGVLIDTTRRQQILNKIDKEK